MTIITIDLAAAKRREEELEREFQEFVRMERECLELRLEMIRASHEAEAEREKARLEQSEPGLLGGMPVLIFLMSLVAASAFSALSI